MHAPSTLSSQDGNNRHRMLTQARIVCFCYPKLFILSLPRLNGGKQQQIIRVQSLFSEISGFLTNTKLHFTREPIPDVVCFF